VILNVSAGKTHVVAWRRLQRRSLVQCGDDNYYTASSGSPLRSLDVSGTADAQGAAILGVIDAEDKNLMLVPTFNVPAVTTGAGQHPAATAHSVPADCRGRATDGSRDPAYDDPGRPFGPWLVAIANPRIIDRLR